MENLSWVLVSVVWAIVPIVSIIAGVMIQRSRAQERIRAIERGVPVPPAWPSPPVLTAEERTAGLRVGGIVTIAVGLGLLVLFTSLAETLPEFPKGVIAVSAIPFLVGVGLLYEYHLRIKERDRSTPR